MAMSGTVLAATIKAKIKTLEGYDKLDDGAMGEIIDVIADETIKHIQTLGIVTTTVVVPTATALATPPAVGAGAGTGSIS